MVTRFTKSLLAGLIVVGLAAPAAAANTNNSATTATSSDNLQLFRNVQREVLRYPFFTIFDSVQAQVDDGVVVLTGKVTMPFKRDALEQRVAKVGGIARVENRIDVLPVSRFDDDLRLRIARAIYSNPNFRPFAMMVNPPIHVIVERGRVTLQGVVLNDTDRLIAQSIAAPFLSFGFKNELQTEQEVRDQLEKL
jgi:hyperosmotically inducible protein